MANTYYKYVERTADSYTNWAEIGKNMSDMLSETNRVREEKKAAIDQASRDFQEKLNNAPQGEDASARKAALEYADNASKFMRMQDQLLKSGKLKLKDYTIARQNLLDGTDQAFSAMTDYQKVFGDKMKRYKEGTSSLGEVKNMAKVEGFGNWAKSGFVINPTNGQVVIAMKDKKIVDGQEVYAMSENPNNIASVNEVRGLIQGEWNKFNVQDATDTWATKLGKDISAIRTKSGSLVSTGEIKTTEDITNRTDIDDATKQIMFKFLDAENQYINSTMVNSYDRASCLLDHIGEADVNGKKVPYFFTQDPKEAASNNAAILQVIDPTTQQAEYKFNADQMKQSNEFVRAIARSKYSKGEEIKETSQIRDETYHPPPPNQSQIDQQNLLSSSKNFGLQTSKLLTGNDAEVKDALNFFRSQGADIEKNPKGKPAGIYIRNANNELVPFESKGDPTKLGTSIVGALRTATGFQGNDDMIIRNFKMGKTLNTTASGSGVSKERDISGEFKTAINSKVTNAMFNKQDNATTASKISQIFNGVSGITVDAPTIMGMGNGLTITYQGAKGAPIVFKGNTNQDPKDAVTMAANLRNWINNLPESVKLQVLGSAGGVGSKY